MFTKRSSVLNVCAGKRCLHEILIKSKTMCLISFSTCVSTSKLFVIKDDEVVPIKFLFNEENRPYTPTRIPTS